MTTDQNLIRRVAVVGPSSAGKTTLARRIEAISGIPYIELDALHWEPNWTPAKPDVLRERVSAALERPAWVVDGNYRVVRDITWGQAEHLIWLDFPLPLVLWRLTRRTFGRWARREVLWNGNRELLHQHFLSKDSLYLWVLQSHRRHRREYPAQFAEYPALEVARLRTPRELEAHVAGLRSRLEPQMHTDEHR